MSPSRDAAPGVRAVETVLAVLPRSVQIDRVVAHRDSLADLTVNGQRLEIKWIGEGRLGDVRRVARERDRSGLIVVARRLSPGARLALSEAGINWVDESGAAEISVGAIVVSRSGTPDARPGRPKGWTPSGLATAEALLCGVRPTASAVAEATGLSMGSCVNALRVLTDLGLLESDAARGRGSARRLADPDRLLEAYASVAPGLTARTELEVGVTWRDPAEGIRSIVKRWDAADIAYAATGVVASETIAPHLTGVGAAEVYVERDTVVGLEAAAAVVGLRPVPGGRLKLRPFPTVATNRLATTVDGLRVAPWPRVFVDLQHAGVRGEDAAEHLKEVMSG